MDDDDLFGDDDLFVSLAAASTAAPAPRIVQPTPQKIQQPTPQRLDRAPPSSVPAPGAAKIVQPTPQAVAKPSSGSAILVSPRQRGNPVLACLKSLPWEYSDIPADYGLGLTTCALFLSLKYHRLHPEYIYTRIRNLQGKYQLRILLTMVDIPNHEDSVRELSKTSLVNNVTVILCWSAAEAARYLELYKSYEHANFAAIRGQQASTYAEKLVEFVTVPRGINKADAIALVCNFGSLRNAVNADAEQVGLIGGWGEKKVKKWCGVVDEPFRAKKAAKRKVNTSATGAGIVDKRAVVSSSRMPLREVAGAKSPATQSPSQVLSGSTISHSARQPSRRPDQFQFYDPELDDDDDNDDEEAMMARAIEESKRTYAQQTGQPSSSGTVGTIPGPSGPQNVGNSSGITSSSRGADQLSDGVAAALAKLRRDGGA